MFTPRVTVGTMAELEAQRTPHTFLFGDKIKPVPPFIQSLVRFRKKAELHYSSNAKLWSEEANA